MQGAGGLQEPPGQGADTVLLAAGSRRGRQGGGHSGSLQPANFSACNEPIGISLQS